MKLITLHQPWASLVALQCKRYETRHWPTSYRGPLLIHAAKRHMRKGDIAILRAEVEGTLLAEDVLNEALEKIEQAPHYGCILALAELTDCLVMTDVVEDATPEPQVINISVVPFLERAVGNWDIDRYALQLDDVRPLTQPIPFTSRQGKLLPVPEEIAQAVRSQLELEVVL